MVQWLILLVQRLDQQGASLYSMVQDHRAQKPSRRLFVKALREETDGGRSSSPGRSWGPGLEIEVPFEQRPVNEYSSLKNGVLYSWGELEPGPFFLRVGGLWLVTFTILGVQIAAASFDPTREPLRFVLAAGTGTLFLVSLILLRIYLTWVFECFLDRDMVAKPKFKLGPYSGLRSGWSYVGDRLLSAVVPYEESGWYDGQMWVKPPEVLARDRLLGSYEVKPVIMLLKQTLVGTGALLITGVLLFICATPVETFFRNTYATEGNSTNVQALKTNTKFNIRKEELLQLPVEVKQDDDLAEAADGRPVYCRDRVYRALAGRQYCKWEDLLK
ncbi:hypothetical protein SLEP1_g11804 [Rubroshorea leprosula]|nr:hypothetical protein SLEP1_g11804 [Rubroshorea leprosula]